MTTIPPYLKKGDCIGIVAPAGFMPSEKMQTCIDILEDWGYRVKLGATTNSSSTNYFSGTDEERLRDLQDLRPKHREYVSLSGSHIDVNFTGAVEGPPGSYLCDLSFELTDGMIEALKKGAGRANASAEAKRQLGKIKAAQQKVLAKL